MCECALFEQSQLVTPFVEQRERPSLGVFMLPLMHETSDEKLEPFKLPWNVQHEMVLRYPDRVAVCSQGGCRMLAIASASITGVARPVTTCVSKSMTEMHSSSDVA